MRDSSRMLPRSSVIGMAITGSADGIAEQVNEQDRVAAAVSLDWELLGQSAQAAKNSELLELTKRCHPQALRQMRWANAMLKVLSPQVLAS